MEQTQKNLLAPGHSACAGCGELLAARLITNLIGPRQIIVQATGCLEVTTTKDPESAWEVPWIHSLFDNTGSVAAGIEVGLRALGRDGNVKVIASGGDGALADIGFGALSGMWERGHNVLTVCYDNEAYMNTGIQRSGATPHGAETTTSPAGSVIPGKPEWKKDLIGICVAHGIEYAATASPAYWNDYITKVRKGIEVNGPAVINVLSPCPLGWRHDSARSMEMVKLAVETRYFPVYEFERGKYKLNLNISKPKPVEEFLKLQGRFSHLFKPTYRKDVIDEIQQNVDANWDRIQKLCQQS
jgi:pyruvate ferredoxin oxidoreductase beta subunit